MNILKKFLAFIVIGTLGTLFHFMYKWTGNNMLAGYIFPVNESIWEHLKLIFYPSIIYYTIEYLFTKDKPENYIQSVIIGIFKGMLLTVVLYYTYSGILGKNIDFINIAIFFISVIKVIVTKNKVEKSGKYTDMNLNIILIMSLILFVLVFAVWSYNPPSLGIFLPPDA